MFNFAPSPLFKRLPTPDRQETRLAYEASYYPSKELNSFHQITWSKTIYMRKQAIELCILDNKFLSREGDWAVHWEYNNIPTEIEWKKYHDDARFKVHLRISPLIKAGNGRVALLSLC